MAGLRAIRPAWRVQRNGETVATAANLPRHRCCLLSRPGSVTEPRPRCAHSPNTNVMIVGHEPQLSNWPLILTGSAEGIKMDLKKGGCIALRLSARPEKGGSELLWVLTPRQLRKLR